MTNLSSSEHIQYVCPRDHADAKMCMFCEGGLFACTRCNAFEGATPTDCPGVMMTAEQSDAVYKGQIDFLEGRWITGCCKTMFHLSESFKTLLQVFKHSGSPAYDEAYAQYWEQRRTMARTGILDLDPYYFLNTADVSPSETRSTEGSSVAVPHQEI